MGTYRHLSREDREQIAVLRAAGHSNAGIAVALGRAPSTISREVRRNALDSGRYSARTADGAYLLRRQRSALLERDKRLARFVRDRLTEGWSPQQISGWLQSGAELGLRTVAMETIYAFLYRDGQKAEQLWRFLARRHKRRRKPAARRSRDTIKDRVSIHERPENINDRSEIGHWEGDLIIGDHGDLAQARSQAPPVDHLRQRHRVRPPYPAARGAGDDDMVLRCLRLLAEGRDRERQWPAAPVAATPDQHRQPRRRRPPGDRYDLQPDAPEMPRLHHADPGPLQRPRQRCHTSLREG